ncbi:pre-rRNA processing protein [Recurvomyces mirabilis]|uniref:Pre-rRNA processing protein n=1 Tax=Recurvomyces mirabilis TaxID=574656 RepID=A0AAE0WHV5_9PEZI|nr:pre-rRNA processing protein [Recurvomyces mirabilis]KAK5158241.1 pre-rRNA processing protein [Recurvomyces mirabilis]
MSLQERLEKIRNQPKLQSAQQTAVVLSAIEDTLRTQKSEPTATAYFAALLSLLGQYISTEKGIVNKEVAYAVVYLLDLVTSHVSAPLLRSKFPQILASLAPALTHPDAEAPLLRASIGCLESLLVAQDGQAWALPQSASSPRGAVGALLALAMDQRPKVRRRAQDALDKVLRHPPPIPSLDHPAADMCAESSLRSLQAAADEANSKKKQKHRGQKDEQGHEPGLMHALQLVKGIASAENGWPSKKLDALCALLLSISRGSNEFLTMAAFEVFEIIFAGLAGQVSSAKLPRLLDAIKELQPSQNDSQLLPPWIAVLSRGHEVAGQIEPQETFENLPDLFDMVALFLASSSHNIRISASECLISLLSTCVPDSVILEPSIMDDKALERIAGTMQELLSVKYQTAWTEVFNVATAAFNALKWRAHPLLRGVLQTVGDLRSNDSFAGKKEADAVLSAAIHAMGPGDFLATLPLNLGKPVAGRPGRAWLLPLMRDSVSNTRLAHFRSELVPLSETMFQRVLNHGSREKTMEIKIFETVVSQIWACLPGYCELPLDLQESFDQTFAEMLSNLLYQQPQLRTEICKALQNLVDTNKAIAELEGETEDLIRQGRVTKIEAAKNLQHLAGLASNLLAVLFNVYSQTLPHNRGNLLQCINAFLSITPDAELMETFQRVATMLEAEVAKPVEVKEVGVRKQQLSSEEAKNKMPLVSHTLMDLVITMSIYLPRDSFAGLFVMASKIVQRQDDPQLQKKAYKLVPRLAESDIGQMALKERSTELQQLLLAAADKASAPAKRDRLASLSKLVPFLPKSDLSFIPSVLSEVVIGVKEVNEKARTAAFDLLVLMGQTMSEGGIVVNSKVPHMPPDAHSVEANLEEYFTMVSAGLAGSTPHMISASITALTRLLYEFRSQLKQETVVDLVQTMDLFLTSNNREIVRSVLGFVKVCVISLPTELMLPRLETLVPNLVVWSHEHKAQFKAKVKHIFERMIRRFGVEIIEKYTPEADKKLIANIRKTRDRRKRKNATDAEEGAGAPEQRKGRFESEYDEAVYGSDEEQNAEDSDISDDEVLGRAVEKGKSAKQKGGKQYIVEDEDEPLDLLDRRALAHVSSTKPAKNRGAAEPAKRKADVDLDGKLVFNEDSDDNNDVMDFDDRGMFGGQEPGDGTLEGGINAYVSALKGKDAPRRGENGKLKFSNKRSSGADDEDEMEIDEREIASARKQGHSQARGGAKQKPVRRGLGMEKARPVGGGGAGIRKQQKRPFKHGLQAKRGKGTRRHDSNRS